MAEDASSTICMRVTQRQRQLLETVASAQGQPVSAFVRSAATDVARRLIEEDGPQGIIKKAEVAQREAARRSLAELKELKESLRKTPWDQDLPPEPAVRSRSPRRKPA